MEIPRLARRTFIGLLTCAAWRPFGAEAQQKKVRIGMLSPADREPFYSVFAKAMSELGYDDQRLELEFRTADGKPDALPQLARDLVERDLDVIVASQTPSVTALKAATTKVPIVMVAGDPVGTGVVASLNRPGGNITGVSATTAEMGVKLLEVLRSLVPGARHIGVLANEADPFTKSFAEQIDIGSRALGIRVSWFNIRSAADYESACAAMAAEKADAVVVQPSLPRRVAIDTALKYQIPPISPSRLFPADGAVMSYSANQADMFRRMALYVDRILKGASPGDLPVEQPTKFELVINRKTASLLGLNVPMMLLARADEVIE
jgi:putative ABC transport system substrate-binding protein